MPTYFGFITIHELLRLSAPAVHPSNKPDRTPVANDSDIVANKLTSKSLRTRKRRKRKQKLDEVYLTGLPLTWKTWKSWNLNETSQSQEICPKSQGICNRIPKVQEKSGNFVVWNSFSAKLKIIIMKIFWESMPPDPPKYSRTHITALVIENTVGGTWWLLQGKWTFFQKLRLWFQLWQNGLHNASVKIYQKLRRFFDFWEFVLENKRNSTITKYMADYRFLLRGQNVLTSVIKT